MKSFTSLCCLFFLAPLFLSAQDRGRARDFGIEPGMLSTGKWNAITDVDGVKVGHKTLIRGENVRTGVTVILPHEGNIFQEKVPAAVSVGNGFGKALGFTQVEELGNLETPIALTNTLNVFTRWLSPWWIIPSSFARKRRSQIGEPCGRGNQRWLAQRYPGPACKA